MVVVRRARVEDAEQIALVHVAGWRAGYRHAFPAAYLAGLSVPEHEERWRQVLGAGEAVVLVAEDDRVVVGFAAAVGAAVGPHVRRGTGELRALYVRPDRWGTGTGRRLHDVALGALVGAGCRRAVLWVLDSNARARRCYERWGWACDGEVAQDEYGGTVVDQLRYGRELEVRPGPPASC